MSANLYISGTNFSDYVVSSERTHSMCTSTSTLELTLAPNLPRSISAYEPMLFYENGVKVFTGYVNTPLKARMSVEVTLSCSDVLIRAMDCWLTEEYVSDGESVAYWVKRFLNLAGISNGKLNLIEEYPTFAGFGWAYTSVYDAVMSCLAVVPYQMFADRHGVVRLTQTSREGTPKYTISSYIDYERVVNDSWIRNRVVVFGAGIVCDRNSGENPHLASGEVRTAVAATGQIHLYRTACKLADRMLDEFDSPLDVKTVLVEGNPNYELGQIVSFTDPWTGYSKSNCIITSFSTTLNSTGYMTELTLDEKCEKFWGWDSLPVILPKIYAGTYGAGVYVSEFGVYDYSTDWSAINTELFGDALKVHDIKIMGDNSLWIATDAGLYRSLTQGELTYWVGVSVPTPEGAASEPKIAALHVSIEDPETLYVLAHIASANQVWLYRKDFSLGSSGPWETFRLSGYDGFLDWDPPDTIYSIHTDGKDVYARAKPSGGGKTEIWKRMARFNYQNMNSDMDYGVTTICADYDELTYEGHLRVGGVSSTDGNEVIIREYIDGEWVNKKTGPGGVRDLAQWGTDGCVGRLINREFYQTYPGILADSIYCYSPCGHSMLYADENCWGTKVLCMGNKNETIVAETDRGVGGWHGYVRRWVTWTLWSGDVWTTEWDEAANWIKGWCKGLAAQPWARTTTRKYLMRRTSAGSWVDDPLSLVNDITGIAAGWNAGFFHMFVGSDSKLWIRYPGSYQVLCTFPNGCSHPVKCRGEWYVISDGKVYTCGTPGLKLPTLGRTHLMDEDAMYIYVAALDVDGHPIVLAVEKDLSKVHPAAYRPSYGTWCGVKCDPAYGVWAFGDFGNGYKTLLSTDNSWTWENVTDTTTWSSTELVRSVIPAFISDGIAILTEAKEIWEYNARNEVWTKISDLPFSANCGAEDLNGMGIFIGRDAGGDEILQYGQDYGETCTEISTNLSKSYRIANVCTEIEYA